MKTEYKEEALPFIQVNTKTNGNTLIIQIEYTINKTCIEFLQKLEAPLGIISVAGMYRTGKSYLLNRILLDRQKGFNIGSTVNACTKGLWMWMKPISGFTSEGKEIKVVVIDTEGLGALDADSNHDTRIFGLAVLLSSFFLYNSMGSIDESALQSLSLIINLTRYIQLKTQGDNEVDPEEYGKYFPAFMWIVRDFILQLIDESGTPITSKEYFEKSLELQKGFSESIEQKNKIRRLLKSFFIDRDCCTMVRPLTKEENLQNLENMQLTELRPEFVEQVKELRNKVLNKMKVKMLNGKELNGEMLCNLAKTYVEALNKGVVPNIERAWTYICKNECYKGIQIAINAFDHGIQNISLPIEECELKGHYKKLVNEAVEEFTKRSMGSDTSSYIHELKNTFKQKYNKLKEQNIKQTKVLPLITPNR